MNIPFEILCSKPSSHKTHRNDQGNVSFGTNIFAWNDSLVRSYNNIFCYYLSEVQIPHDLNNCSYSCALFDHKYVIENFTSSIVCTLQTSVIRDCHNCNIIIITFYLV